jgi:2-polyprenyl-6-methoxyphenol hydroxylase-like FAD-dependent oxidoreductase
MKDRSTTCCIAGGGPAGMMLGFLLARAGIPVIVLEKHADFFRDFRGDTIHPSTFNIMHELGLLEDFLKIPHDDVKELNGSVFGKDYHVADFSRLPIAHKALGIMPQWDFLNFLLKQAGKYPTFQLMVNAEAIGAIKEGATVTGVKVKTSEGEINVRSTLLVAADGRGSKICASVGLTPIELGAPMDVLWFRISRKDSDPELPLLHLNRDNVFISIKRGDYYQCGYVIAKGGLEKYKAEGLPAFRDKVAAVLPFAKERAGELKSWDDVKLLSVSVSHLEKWYMEGLLCIGDAAHTMSPIGGVGINMAVQDAVAAANILYQPLRDHKMLISHLEKVQERRAFPARLIQKIQIFIQDAVISKTVNAGNKQAKTPVFFKVVDRSAMLRRFTGRIVGMGIRPEHVRTPSVI